jgi:membrane-bound serine protease (ClpP class)
MEPLFWSILLLVAALALIVLEIFIPSGGVLSVLAALAVIASLAVAFTGGMWTGILMMLVTIVIVPLVVAGAVHWWPRTPIGRLIVLETPASEDEVLPDNPEYRRLGELVGKRGIAKTKMLPSGLVEIDDQTYDALTDGVAIDPGQWIQVIAVRARRIVVMPVDEMVGRLDDDSQRDVLEQSADSLGIPSLDDPA